MFLNLIRLKVQPLAGNLTDEQLKNLNYVLIGGETVGFDDLDTDDPSININNILSVSFSVPSAASPKPVTSSSAFKRPVQGSTFRTTKAQGDV
jgi:hypothetical protein